MKNQVLVGFVLLSLVLVIGASGCSNQANQNTGSQNVSSPQVETANSTQMVDCGELKDPACFINRMNQCLPVTAKMVGTDGSSIQLTILGVENETCHFQRTVSGNSALNLDCHFPKGTMNMDTIAQTFGQDKGLKSVVDAACKSVGW